MHVNINIDGEAAATIVLILVAAVALLVARHIINASKGFFRSDFHKKPAPPQSPSPSPLRAVDYVNDRKFHILLAATGSVATIKIPSILEALSKHPNLSVRLLLSESAAKFLIGQSEEQPSLQQMANTNNLDGIYVDEDEWRKPWVRGDNILHIELRRWADLLVIAPLSANSLAKVANGMSDSLITSVVRAWDATGLIDLPRPGLNRAIGARKPIAVAPAMNTAMWEHPVTKKQITVLEHDWEDWFRVLRPMEKKLACGDTGSGAMRDWREIVSYIEEQYALEVDSQQSAIGSNGENTKNRSG